MAFALVYVLEGMKCVRGRVLLRGLGFGVDVGAVIVCESRCCRVCSVSAWRRMGARPICRGVLREEVGVLRFVCEETRFDVYEEGEELLSVCDRGLWVSEGV